MSFSHIKKKIGVQVHFNILLFQEIHVVVRWLIAKSFFPFTDIVNSITSAFASHDIVEPSQRISQSELLGEIEISQDATVGDLKNQVTTLPAMNEVVVPTVAFLRLRLLEDGRLGRVLRDNNQSLK